jgi:hypothetical protein
VVGRRFTAWGYRGASADAKGLSQDKRIVRKESGDG